MPILVSIAEIILFVLRLISEGVKADAAIQKASKKFVASYVEKVIVYKEHVDVLFKLPVVDLQYGGEGC